MSQITIYVSSFSKKILQTRYGEIEPFKISRSDGIYHHLTAEPLKQNKTTFTKINKLLQETVKIQISDTLFRRLKACKRNVYVGEHLHKIMQEKMLEFVEAQVLVGLPAQRALKNFLEYYNISEDDYSLETAYTAWKRFKNNFHPKNDKKYATFWSGFEPQKQDVCRVEAALPIPPIWVLKSVNDFYKCGYVNLLCKNITIQHKNRSFTYVFDKTVARQFSHQRKVLFYLMYKKCGLTVRNISKITNLSFQQIHKCIQQISFESSIYAELSEEIRGIEQLIQQFRAKALSQ